MTVMNGIKRQYPWQSPVSTLKLFVCHIFALSYFHRFHIRFLSFELLHCIFSFLSMHPTLIVVHWYVFSMSINVITKYFLNSHVFSIMFLRVKIRSKFDLSFLKNMLCFLHFIFYFLRQSSKILSKLFASCEKRFIPL